MDYLCIGQLVHLGELLGGEFQVGVVFGLFVRGVQQFTVLPKIPKEAVDKCFDISTKKLLDRHILSHTA